MQPKIIGCSKRKKLQNQKKTEKSKRNEAIKKVFPKDSKIMIIINYRILTYSQKFYDENATFPHLLIRKPRHREITIQTIYSTNVYLLGERC